MVEIHSDIKVDIFDEITLYDEDKVRQALDKFSKAIGAPIEAKTPVSFNDAEVLINGVPVYLARMCDIGDNSQGIALFAKQKTGGPDYGYDYDRDHGFYSPYTLAAKSAVESLENKMFFLGDGDDEVQIISITSLKGSERTTIAKRLKRKYRIWKRSNNRFVVSIVDFRYSPPHILWTFNIRMATLFDRKNVDQVRKLVMRQRDSNGKMQEVVRYCMEPVLCQVISDKSNSIPYSLAVEYLNRTRCNDNRNRIKYANCWRGFGFLFWGFCRRRAIAGNHPLKGMMAWLHLDI